MRLLFCFFFFVRCEAETRFLDNIFFVADDVRCAAVDEERGCARRVLPGAAHEPASAESRHARTATVRLGRSIDELCTRGWGGAIFCDYFLYPLSTFFV